MQNTGFPFFRCVTVKRGENKQERKIASKEKKEAEELRMFEMKQQKKSEKQKGH